MRSILSLLLLPLASSVLAAEPPPSPPPAAEARLSPDDAKRLDAMTARLAHDSAAEREAAQKELEAWSTASGRDRKAALKELQARLEKAGDPETRARLTAVVERLAPTAFRTGGFTATWKGDKAPLEAELEAEDRLRLRGTGTVRIEGSGAILAEGKGISVRSLTYDGKGKATLGKSAFSTVRIGTKGSGMGGTHQGLTATDVTVDGKGEVIVEPGGTGSVSLVGGAWRLELSLDKADCKVSGPVPADPAKQKK